MLSDELYLRISELKTSYPEIEEILTDIEESQNTFFSTVSHELKSSLAMLNNSLQYLGTSLPQLQLNQYWTDIRNDCGRMETLIRDLSGYSDSFRLHPRRTDLSQLIKDVYRSCLLMTKETKKSLHFENRAGTPYIMADSSHLREALYNLIKNGLEAIDSNGCVKILLTADSRNIRIQISDNGCGIPTERLLNIFQPFVTYKPEGTGLGLSVVKRIVEAHYGHISISSASDLGTTVSVTLPRNAFFDTE